ncbi:ABC transporter substrate-binding protein [Natrialba sp. INN-245]|uniref:ABC transporter substrate-binding protein n=1 Tax=Natrialba sp. INN-245 TaxID=2690967 RepID=UPI00130FDC40|nr:ABC transporter substrate-binding protein [Natrialba sp. INN-245]MWV39982.1 extracellular solute-binding protein [Natrialba sp. INN-245]
MREDSSVSRRRYVQLAGGVGALALAGCTEDEDPDGIDTGNGADDADDTGDSDSEGDLEIVHWWTAGGEEQALNALLDGFEEAYPEHSVENNPAPGGAGAAIDAAIQTRVIDQDPPSTFQIWPGEAVRPYLEADALESIDEVWEDEDAYVDGVIDAAAPDGNLVVAPINIHRLNNLFYNVDVVEDVGVDPTDAENPEDLLDLLEAADDAGYVGLAQQTQEPWGILQFWEMVFLGQYGASTYEQFLAGDAASLESEIADSLELVERISEFHNEDAGTVAWDEANADVITGDAAFHHNGDWAAGEYQGADGFEYGENWEYIPFPGTEGTYTMVMDGFVYPANNPTPEATEAFVSYCTTADAQERFNPHKGSIPPRTDVATDGFPPFLQDQMADFEASDEQTVTISHGSGLEPAKADQVQEAFAVFTDNWDVDETTQELIGIF